jgi:hypothetical protein
MSTTEMTRQQWRVAHFLAGNLAYMNVSKNLVMRLQEYLTAHPDAKPSEYLDRLARLGNTFAGGEDELRQRRELSRIVRTVAQSAPKLNWPLVLAWAARLMVAYRPEGRTGPAGQQEKQTRERIQRELDQMLSRLDKEPYYG